MRKGRTVTAHPFTSDIPDASCPGDDRAAGAGRICDPRRAWGLSRPPLGRAGRLSVMLAEKV